MAQLPNSYQNPDVFMGDTRATTGDHVPDLTAKAPNGLTAHYLGSRGVQLDTVDRRTSHTSPETNSLRLIGSTDIVDHDEYYEAKKKAGLL